ncbi:MAG: aldehyde-activating protein [Gammaproteobacteria bacterium RIFCSPHIGHO2_12_FULL_36_30]|nr:MAG: aldehyde-activating protein [Gammaproteobacteria bacterium RIFCSPHIGHO2_12_FULL_36_30]
MSEQRILQCHCGAVEVAVQFDNGLENIRRCNCSLCKRKGAVMAMVPITNLKVIKGENNLTLYQWNTKVAEHYFCKTCGIYTHHKRRSNPNQYGINIACIEGVNPYNFGEIPIGNANLSAPLPAITDEK